MLNIKNLMVNYGAIEALRGVSLEVNAGEIVSIIGGNGAGKSTFVRLITGAEQPNSGDLLLDGKKVSFKSPLDARDQGMETVYQTLALAED